MWTKTAVDAKVDVGVKIGTLRCSTAAVFCAFSLGFGSFCECRVSLGGVRLVGVLLFFVLASQVNDGVDFKHMMY